jgi:hypothetical protein
MADGSGAGTQPVLGSGWPNRELFESEEAFVTKAGGSASDRQHTVRIHLDVSSTNLAEYERLRTDWAEGRWFSVGMTLSAWVRQMSVDTGRSPGPALELLRALPPPLQNSSQGNGALEYYLLTDYGDKTVHLFRFIMNVKVGGEEAWDKLVHACANRERKEYVEVLTEALGSDRSDAKERVIEASWPL